MTSKTKSTSKRRLSTKEHIPWLYVIAFLRVTSQRKDIIFICISEGSSFLGSYSFLVSFSFLGCLHFWGCPHFQSFFIFESVFITGVALIVGSSSFLGSSFFFRYKCVIAKFCTESLATIPNAIWFAQSSQRDLWAAQNSCYFHNDTSPKKKCFIANSFSPSAKISSTFCQI